MMRTQLLAILLVGTLPLAASSQDEKTTRKEAKKGDTILVKGCLDGGALQAVEAEGLEDTGLLAQGLTFRLTGEKRLLKELKDGHDRRVVSVRGVLKSDLPRQEGQSRDVGRMRIRIGGASPGTNSPFAESQRVLPILEVKSYTGVGVGCGR